MLPRRLYRPCSKRPSRLVPRLCGCNRLLSRDLLLILVAVLIVFFPVMVNVLTAIRTVDPDLVNLARAFTATRAQIFWKIEFPASLPPLFAGLRIASTLAVVGVVVGELVGGNLGLGYLLAFGEGQANTAMVFVAILMLTLVGGIAYLAVIVVEQRVLHYLPRRALSGV